MSAAAKLYSKKIKLIQATHCLYMNTVSLVAKSIPSPSLIPTVMVSVAAMVLDHTKSHLEALW